MITHQTTFLTRYLQFWHKKFTFTEKNFKLKLKIAKLNYWKSPQNNERAKLIGVHYYLCLISGTLIHLAIFTEKISNPFSRHKTTKLFICTPPHN